MTIKQEKQTLYLTPELTIQYCATRTQHFILTTPSQPKQLITINRPFQCPVGDMVLFGLLVVEKEQRTFYFLKEEVVIGRMLEADLVFELPSISKKHAVIVGGKIKDCGSRNGIYVNSLRVTQAKLQLGDVVFIGGVLLYYYESFIGIDEVCHTSLDKVNTQDVYLQSEVPCSKVMVLPPEPEAPSLSMTQQKFPWTMLIYPLMYFLDTQKLSLFMLSSSLIAVIQFLSILYQNVKRRRVYHHYLQEKTYYRDQVLSYYPNPQELYERYLRLERLLVRQGEINVRLGTNSEGVVIHCFNQSPRLVVVSKKGLVESIVFQMSVYYPYIQLVFTTLEPCFWALDSRIQTQETQFYIGRVPTGAMGIDWVNSLKDAPRGYDGLVFEDSYIVKHSQVQVTFDEVFNENYYPLTFRYTLAVAPDFETCMGLTHHAIAHLRKMHDITEHLYGLMSYEQWLDVKEGHLLLAGMTGSGKSEWLHTFLLSMAIWYDSRVLNFFIIDFKGGGLSQSFASLAHTTATLTNLEPEHIERALKALEVECLEREKRFLDTHEKNMTLTTYLALGYPPIPHLFIVVDEFAELKQHYPEAMKHLIQIARIGRSLGVHLILSTQQPSGIVDAQIKSNLANIVCLKMASPQDSYELLHSKKAAYLTQAGDFYLKQQGNHELIYGHSPLVSKQEMWLRLYNHELKPLFSLKKTDHHHAFEDLVKQINQRSPKASPLYYDHFIEVKGCFAVIDDYRHRQMQGYHPRRLLILGMDVKFCDKVRSQFPQYTFKPLQESCEEDVIYYDDSRRANYRLFSMFDEILALDDYYLQWLSVRRLSFHCDLSKKQAILFLKGDAYVCQLQWSF